MEYHIEANKEKNRLYLILKGFFNAGEMELAANITIEEAKKLQPGFDVINDITQFVPGTEVGAKHILRAQAFVKDRGAKRIVRIVKDLGFAKVGKQQFRSSGQQVDGYEALEVASVEDAERLLDGEPFAEAVS